MSQFKLANKTALITGAGSGIGQAIAVSLAKRQCNLILTDINDNGLDTTVDLIKPYGVQTRCYQLDVGDKYGIHDFASKIEATDQPVDILVNNAGVALGGTFEQTSAEDFEWLMDINFYGVIRMTRAFLPLLKTRPQAQIVNISSVFGMVAPPGQTAYSSSKFAVRGFSEALRHELQMENSSIGVTQVHPGGIKTNIAKNARISKLAPQAEIDKGLKDFERMLQMPAEQAGEIIVKGIEQRKDRVLVGNDAHAISLITRFLQISYFKLLERFL